MKRRTFMKCSAASLAAVSVPKLWGEGGAPFYTGPLIETHCHIDGRDGSVFAEEMLALQALENLQYALLLGGRDQNFRAAAEMLLPFQDRAGLMLFIHPDKHAAEELKPLLAEYPQLIRGFKLHPSGMGFRADLETLDWLFALANETDLLVVSHTDKSENSQAGLFRPLMERYPQTKLVLCHAFPFEQALDVASSFKNVYIDTSYTAWNAEFQRRALRELGKEKILFGIDSPWGFPKDEDGRYLPHYRAAATEVAAFFNNDPDVVAHVMYKNAARLLNV